MIEDEQDAGGHEYGESGQTHAGGDEPCPSAQRQAPQAHAASSHIERGGDEVQCAEQLANAEQSNGGCPENHASALAGAGNRSNCTQRCVLSPTAQGWSLTHEERRDQNEESHESDPKRHHVESWERHVLRADLDWQKEVTEACERRSGKHKK